MKQMKFWFLSLLVPFHLSAFDQGQPEFNGCQESYVECQGQQEQYDANLFEGSDCQANDFCASSWCQGGWDLRFRVAGFYPQDKRFRRIYARWSPEYQVEVSKQVWCNTYGWLNVGWYSKKGHSLGLRNDTRVSILPVSFGLKQKINIRDRAKLYFGLGASYAWLRTIDDSRFVKKYRSEDSWGGIVKTGIEFCLCHNLFLDVFADYVYQPVGKPRRGHRRVVTRKVNIGGWKVGGGIGYQF